jgi:hypothetical protein
MCLEMLWMMLGFSTKTVLFFQECHHEGCRNEKCQIYARVFHKYQGYNGQDITASMSHAIEPSWQSVFFESHGSCTSSCG